MKNVENFVENVENFVKTLACAGGAKKGRRLAMRFIPLAYESADAAAVRDWSAEYKAGHRIGALSLGSGALFFRKAFTVYVVPYTKIRRYFRRVLAIPARIGCCADRKSVV